VRRARRRAGDLQDDVEAAKNLLIAADVNAVPPLGVEGCGLHDSGVVVSSHGALGIGALAIGNVNTARSRACSTNDRLCQAAVLDFRDAFALARTLV